MKNLVYLFLLVGPLAFGQTIRIADNNPTAPSGANVYKGNSTVSAIQQAVNAAQPGDIVYVQPSTINYGDVTIDHQITLRGIGFNTGKDIPLTSAVGNIGLTNTLTNTTNASGTTIDGLAGNHIYLGFQTGTFTYTLQNITITNCTLAVDGITRAGGYMPATNITIQNCFTGISFNPTGTVSQLFIYQSYLYQLLFYGGGSLTSSIITNNNFLGENNVSNTFFINRDLHDAIVSNNIFYGCAPNASGGGIFERNAFSNNLSFGTTADALPPVGTGSGNTGANNKVSVDPKFTNAPFNSLWSATMDFTLVAGSPAINAGSDGTNIGITGGVYPITGGNINVKPTSAPVIMTLNPAAMVPQNQPVNTNIKAKSN